MDWGLVHAYTPLFVTALRVTLMVSAGGVAAALVVGLLVAIVRLWHVPVLDQLSIAYVEVARNTPSLVQLFFLYFGLPKLGILLSQEACAIVCLAFLGGGYMAEARRQAMRHVVLPQAMAQATPALVANVVFLVKESSVVSGIALADLMYVAKDIIGQSYDTAEALFLLVAAYAIILLPISAVGSAIERRFAYGR